MGVPHWTAESSTCPRSGVSPSGSIGPPRHTQAVTVSREADGWYACVSCADVPIEPLPLTGNETGIDVGLKVFLVTADGETVENPRYHHKAEQSSRRAQRRLSRRKKGSKRWRKAVRQCAKKHQKVRRQRSDFHHKRRWRWCASYDTIYLEDLQIRNLSKRPKAMPDGNGGYAQNGARRKSGLNKSINDAGWYAFRRILTCKAAWAGKRVKAGPPAFTTQECSGCGERIEKSLSVRTHACTKCGRTVDRDENAALNILRVGRQGGRLDHRAGQARQALTWVDAPSVA